MIDHMLIDASGRVQDGESYRDLGVLMFRPHVSGDALGGWYRTAPEDIEAAEKEATEAEERKDDLKAKIQTAVEILDKANDIEDYDMFELIQKALEVLND